jgi:hypothetical protein
MPFQTQQYTGLLRLDGPKSYLVTRDNVGNAVFTLMMLYISPGGVFNWTAVAAARNHFVQRGLTEGSPIKFLGFVTDEDANGIGAIQPVLHVVQDLG